MKKIRKSRIYPFIFMGFAIIALNTCKKDESLQKKDPVISWSNPDDIAYGTLLSSTQLNATADVPGTFVYTPESGTKLNEGADQDLKVDFTPTDAINYNLAGKTVKINVIASAPGTVTDVDGNIYNTVTIGTQVWMLENLKTTRYNDGSPIANETSYSAWGANTTGAYCWYNNDAVAYKGSYGALYNWYVVDIAGNGGKNVCPAGWHVPGDAEWTTLIDFLGGESVAGGKMKETGLSHWKSPNTSATNESGFTALPGGRRSDIGYGVYDFEVLGEVGNWWSITAKNANYSWYCSVDCYWPNTNRGYPSNHEGFSIRCIKD